MADAYVGEIRVFAGNFAPKGWHFCDGSLLSIAQNTALYSILGTRFGGDGKNTFALPNLKGRAPVGHGAGPDLTPRQLGEKWGEEKVTLLSIDMPAHGHTAIGNNGEGGKQVPNGHYWSGREKGRDGVQQNAYASTPNTFMAADALAAAGNTQPHNNMQPYLEMSYIICQWGEFPPRP